MSDDFRTLCIKESKLITENIGGNIFFCISMSMDILEVIGAICFLLCKINSKYFYKNEE